MQERIEYGHTFRRDPLFPRNWTSTEGNLVIVTEPNQETENWKVLVVATDKTLEMSGENAEDRAFSVAEAFTRQKLTA